MGILGIVKMGLRNKALDWKDCDSLDAEIARAASKSKLCRPSSNTWLSSW